MQSNQRRSGNLGLEMKVFLVVLSLLLIIYESHAASLEQQILDSLLVNTSYDKRVPPGVDYGELAEEYPTNVSVQLYITEIYHVNVDEMDFSITFYLHQKWYDYRLMFNYSDVFLQLDKINIERVWTPDTYFPESKEGYFHQLTKPNVLMHVLSNGTVIYSMRLRARLACTMHFRLYPLDIQRCRINLKSYGFTADKVSYLWFDKDPVIIDHDNLPLYNIMETPPTDVTTCNNGVYLEGFSCLETTIILKRSIGYYLTELFIPDILIVVLSWTSFWLHPTAVPGRVSLGVVTVLTMSSQGSASRQRAPKSSYIKAIDVWSLFHILFVFAAMIEFSIANVLSRKKDKRGKQDPDVRPFLSTAKRIDQISRIVFPVAYLIFNILFWLVVTNLNVTK